MVRKLAIPLLGILLWVLSLHSGSFTDAFIQSFPVSNEQGFYLPSKLPHIKTIRDTPAAPSVTVLGVLKLSEKNLNDSSKFGESIVGRYDRLETNLGWSDIKVQHGTAAHGQLIESGAVAEALPSGRAALVAARASQHLLSSHCQKISVNKRQCAHLLTTFSMAETQLGGICNLIKKTCRSDELASKYRSIDGTCNHITDENTTKGKSFSAYRRSLFPSYLDGIMEPRRSVTKRPLPSARFISSKLVQNVDKFDSQRTLAFMQWSQFVSHDMSHTANSKMVSSKNPIMCCDQKGYTLTPRYIHPMCLPISIPHDDPFYSKHRTNCMSYVRSLPAVRSDCTFGPIDQMNQATHYLDGSHIYGTTLSKSNSLREFFGGRLLTSNKDGQEFLPTASNAKELCQITSDSIECYRAGDARVNMQPHLTAMHTFWTREHNRIADELQEINPHWDDEKLFQEARRIVIAEIQHITYQYWLPVVVGKINADRVNSQQRYFEDIDPTVSNAFATAAIRFVNSLMTSVLHVYEEDRSANKSVRLQDHFNKPLGLHEDGHLDGLIRGLATQPSQSMDLQFISDITQQLYKVEKYGMDALSLDIQRGRDHGLPPYVEYRELCGLPSVNTFEGFMDYCPSQAIQSLRKIYASPLDVDLIVGGLAERPLPGSLLGPTFTCLISDQMRRTRAGDRYFYTFGSSFKPDQLQEIRKASLARIFCDNGDTIRTMQPDVFSAIQEGNNLVSCDSSVIERINLNKWKEENFW